jgi:protein-tyrosine kinase
MSTLAEFFHSIPEPEFIEAPIAEPGVETNYQPGCSTWNSEDFATQQLQRLVRQVFLPGWPKPARQVVLSPVDETTNISEVCLALSEALTAQVSGSVCVVEADSNESNALPESESNDARGHIDGLRNVSQRISNRLWLVTQDGLFGQHRGGFSTAWLRGRLAELRLEFDYTIVQAPAAVAYSQTALLGHLCDGLILVLQANATRRATAKKVQEMLDAAHARVLGTILMERTFPIPDSIYRRL